MFIPLIVWAIGAAVSAGSAVVATTGAILATSILTVGGVSITIGGVLAAAGAFGLAAAVFSETDSYSNEYISDYEKEAEKQKLKSILSAEKRNLINMISEERSRNTASEMKKVLDQAEEFESDDEYFKALNILNQFKIIYAQKKTDERLAQQAEKIARKLIKVRKETHRLRGRVW